MRKNSANKLKNFFRDQLVIKARQEGMRYVDIAKKFKISGERVRQIVSPDEKIPRPPRYCNTHKNAYWNTCKYCRIVQLAPSFYTQKRLQKEVSFFRNVKHRGNKEDGIKKSLLVKYLKDKKGMNYLAIAKLLNDDHTSIMYLYRKQV